MNRSLVFLFAVGLTFIATTSCGEGDESESGDAGGGTCGNGKVEGAELCDGYDLNHETCSTVGDGIYSKGTLLCTDKCVFDISMCSGENSYMHDMDGGGTGGTGGG